MANRPFFPTLNAIRSAKRGELDGYHVAEAFDQVSKIVKQLNDQLAAVKPAATAAAATGQAVVTATTSTSSKPASTSAPSFADLISGTNAGAAMVVGAGASLDYTGVGIINASQIAGVVVSGTPSVGYVLIATSPTTAKWSPLGLVTAIDCMDATSIRGGIDCGSLS